MTPSAHTILVVDDEQTIVETLTDVLSYEGYRVVSASNGSKGFDAAQKANISLVLLDFMMPVLDGVALARKLREDPRYKELPIIMMTAAPAGLPKTDTPWTLLLVKPFELEELLTSVRQLLPE